MKMTKMGLIFAAAMILGSQSAFAETITCKLTKFTGSEEDIVINWVGTKFIVDTKANTVQTGNEDGWHQPMEISETKVTNRFKTYIIYKHPKDVEGSSYNMRYAFRVYENGNGYAQLTEKRYIPLKGSGTCS